MLSRRSVRVKVMQLLYAQDRDPVLKSKDIVNAYHDEVQKSYELFLFSLYVIMSVSECSTQDEKKRKSKHLPSDLDKIFSNKLFTNEIISGIAANKVLLKKFEKLGFDTKVNNDYINKIYDEFSKKEEYTAFLKNEQSKDETIELLLELYRFCRQDEYFNEMLEDSYYNWLDDKSLVVGSVKKFLKALPSDNANLADTFLPDDETVKDFGLNLLKLSIKNKDKNMKVIIPVLENWDHERLAIIDTILIRMALTEFLDFPTIPSKVTLNEYVELAKQYSTAKSKEFINGILDKLMKNFEENNELKKEGRGLIS
ncbi:MAG: transcription antitermination factor NusB [Saprospiraceae bacterium]|nr:transcription antitermination factor NusB [Bacteroidia bacterium]NNE16394.1 transcription antitermination factor NusB [Saprospiraceae bacterium]NNL93502.1 transcription antitermination factor NusB [Saprospiraceae bacterium]